jgi:hypothetical protein
MDLERIARRVAAASVDALTNSLSPEAAEALNAELGGVRGPGKAAEVLARHGLKLGDRRGRAWTLRHERLTSPLRTHYLTMDSGNVPSLEPKRGGAVDWREIGKRLGPFTEEPAD